MMMFLSQKWKHTDSKNMPSVIRYGCMEINFKSTKTYKDVYSKLTRNFKVICFRKGWVQSTDVNYLYWMDRDTSLSASRADLTGQVNVTA